jgi:hypothetical protein
MKSLAHSAEFALALVVAGLVSGCASSAPSASYQQPAQDFVVVETSTKRPLTDTEMAEVRASVTSYLDREGATDSGDYFLKVYLTPENVDAESEWVVVRFTRYTAQRVVLAASYPYDNLMYSSYYPYYAYDIYPYGYGCVSRISFQYYVDPFYHKRYAYYPRHGHGGHKGGGHHDRDNANNHGGKPGNPPANGNGSNYPRGPKYTENRPGLPQNRPVDGEYRGPRSRRTNPGERETPVAQGQGDNNPGESLPVSSGETNSSGRPGVPPPPSTTPRSQLAANPPPLVRHREPSNNQQARNRPDGAPGQNRAVNPTRTEARRDPPANRPPPSNRPAQQPPRNHQPARAYQPPARQSAPVQQQPARSEPSSAGSRDRQSADNQREVMR